MIGDRRGEQRRADLPAVLVRVVLQCGEAHELVVPLADGGLERRHEPIRAVLDQVGRLGREFHLAPEFVTLGAQLDALQPAGSLAIAGLLRVHR